VIYIRQIIEKNIDELKEKYIGFRDTDKATLILVDLINRLDGHILDGDGFIDPIIINSKNEIISGNTRYNACKLLGRNTISCIVVDFKDDTAELEYVISSNQITTVAYWNVDMLIAKLHQLPEDFVKFFFGYSVSEIMEETGLLTLDEIERAEKGRKAQNKITDFFGD